MDWEDEAQGTHSVCHRKCGFLIDPEDRHPYTPSSQPLTVYFSPEWSVADPHKAKAVAILQPSAHLALLHPTHLLLFQQPVTQSGQPVVHLKDGALILF